PALFRIRIALRADITIGQDADVGADERQAPRLRYGIDVDVASQSARASQQHDGGTRSGTVHGRHNRARSADGLNHDVSADVLETWILLQRHEVIQMTVAQCTVDTAS